MLNDLRFMLDEIPYRAPKIWNKHSNSAKKASEGPLSTTGCKAPNRIGRKLPQLQQESIQ